MDACGARVLRLQLGAPGPSRETATLVAPASWRRELRAGGRSLCRHGALRGHPTRERILLFRRTWQTPDTRATTVAHRRRSRLCRWRPWSRGVPRACPRLRTRGCRLSPATRRPVRAQAPWARATTAACLCLAWPSAARCACRAASSPLRSRSADFRSEVLRQRSCGLDRVDGRHAGGGGGDERSEER